MRREGAEGAQGRTLAKSTLERSKFGAAEKLQVHSILLLLDTKN